MRVPQLARERGLVQELRAVHRAELGVLEYLGLDHLHRNFLAGKGIRGEIDRPGRALAELPADVVLADLQAQIHFEGLGHQVRSIRIDSAAWHHSNLCHPRWGKTEKWSEQGRQGKGGAPSLPFPAGPLSPKVGDRRSGPPEEVGTFPSRGIETFGA